MSRVAPESLKEIAWSDLEPEDVPGQVGSLGVEFRAKWISKKKRVAVKVPKVFVVGGGGGGGGGGGEWLGSDTWEALETEARNLIRVSDDGTNEYVAKLIAVVKGAPSKAWVQQIELEQSRGSFGGLPSHVVGLVMEWIDGDSLYSSLFPSGNASVAPWPSTLSDRVRVLAEAAEGLWRLQNQNIIHGDIKSDSLLLHCESSGGSGGVLGTRHVKLTDFGFTKLRAASSRASSSVPSASVVSTNTMRGTWRYMAPEMYKGRDASGAVVEVVDGCFRVWYLVL